MSLDYFDCFKRLLEIANKYALIIDGEKITLFSLKSRKEITDLIYALHEEWSIHNVEEETGEDFFEFLYENIGSDSLLLDSYGEYIDINF